LLTRIALIGVAPSLAFERAAVACPFCGGKGASGLVENLLLVAVLWFGARALMRSLHRRRRKEPPPERDASSVG